MNASDIPRKLVFPWASQAGGSFIHSVPDAGTTSDTEASFQQGFPPLSFQPLASGGAPVDGKDMNYVLNVLSAWARWTAAGGVAVFDGTFAGAVGGYQKGAVLQSTTIGVLWQSTVDGNTGNPDAGAANWVRVGGADKFGQVRQSITAPNIYSVTFPAAFPNACTCVIMSGYNSTASGQRDVFPQLVSYNATGFSYVLQLTGNVNTDPTLDGIDWIAKGN